MPSPPTNVDSPPSTPGMPATPASKVSEGRRVAGNGMTPTLPSLNAAVQVGPASSVELGSTAPASSRPFQVTYTFCAESPSSSDSVPSSFITSSHEAQLDGKQVTTKTTP